MNFLGSFSHKSDKHHTCKAGFILALQYALYFGAMGAYLPYFNLYCYRIGFTGFEIGVISSVRTLVTAFFPIAWGWIADKKKLKGQIFIWCNIASSALWGLFLIYTDFTAMLIITVCYGIFYAPIISFIETFAMEILGPEKNHYGRFRVWGSLSFIGVVVVLGRVIDSFPLETILWVVLTLSVIMALLSPIMAKYSKENKSKDFKTGLKAILKPRVICFLSAAFLMLVSHGTYYGFLSIHMENLGYSRTFIGWAWAIASIAEICVMVISPRIFSIFTHETVLVFSFILAAVRWAIFGLVTSAGWIIFAQLFHAFSYGAFHVASILYMDDLIPDPAKTLGQAVNNAITYGFGIMAGFFLNGLFFDSWGAAPLFFASSAIAISAAILFAIPQIQKLIHAKNS